MKPSRPKIHLIDVTDPIDCWTDLRMRCGVVISHALPRVMFTEGVPRVWPARTCQKCIGLEPCGMAKRHYIYGLVEAQEEKLSETAEWEAVS